jgi:hypothetical protein
VTKDKASDYLPPADRWGALPEKEDVRCNNSKVYTIDPKGVK